VCAWSLSRTNLLNITNQLCEKHEGTESDNKQSSCQNSFSHHHDKRCWCSGLKDADFIMCLELIQHQFKDQLFGVFTFYYDKTICSLYREVCEREGGNNKEKSTSQDLNLGLPKCNCMICKPWVSQSATAWYVSMLPTWL